MLDSVAKALGMTPNLHATLAHSPAALRSYLSQVQALGGGMLSTKLREQIALTAAGINACDYCASAHTLFGKHAGVDERELARNLRGLSNDPRTNAALQFAQVVIDSRGSIEDHHLAAVRQAGFTDGEIVEIVANVSVNLLTNYFNQVAGTEVDFPFVPAAESKAA